MSSFWNMTRRNDTSPKSLGTCVGWYTCVQSECEERKCLSNIVSPFICQPALRSERNNCRSIISPDSIESIGVCLWFLRFYASTPEAVCCKHACRGSTAGVSSSPGHFMLPPHFLTCCAAFWGPLTNISVRLGVVQLVVVHALCVGFLFSFVFQIRLLGKLMMNIWVTFFQIRQITRL